MSIWGHRDSEPPAEEAHESQAGAQESQTGAHDTQEPATEHQAGEPAPAFWRAQGETPASLGRDSEATDTPGPALTGVVIDGGSAARDPALTGAQQPAEHEEQAAAHDAGTQEPTATDAAQPVVTEAGQSAVAPEPVV